MRKSQAVMSLPERKPLLVLGTDDYASAVGHALAQAGLLTLLARDPDVPVLRRAMSYDDALEYGATHLGGVTACAVASPLWTSGGGTLGVTALPAETLLDPALIDGVIDARMRRRDRKSDLRGTLPFAIGLGPGFEAGRNVDLAVETAPEAVGRILRRGATIPAHGKSVSLGGAGRERFGRAPCTGVWRTHMEIGDAVEAGAVIGVCGSALVQAPLAGHLRGLVRYGTKVAEGHKLLEIDPRGSRAQCHGISPRAAAIAAATLLAVREACAMSHVSRQMEAAAWLA